MTIFETNRLIVRGLLMSDLSSFYEMESNPRVLQYADGEVKNLEESRQDLENLISKYEDKDNDFWIYAIERKEDSRFIGTLAFVKDEEDDEIGYRFLEVFWGKGYATEICEAMIQYCRTLGMQKIVGYVVDRNIASARILEKFNFQAVYKFVSEDLGLPETKYELELKQ